MKAVKKIFKHWEMFLLVFLVLEFVVFGAVNPKFLRPQSIMNSIVNYISVCIIALFVTLVMITGGIDIQAASIIGLTSIVQGYLWSDLGVNIWAAMIVSIVLAAVCGGLSGFFIAYCGVQPMVVTLAAASCIRAWRCWYPACPPPPPIRASAASRPRRRTALSWITAFWARASCWACPCRS